MPDCFQNSSFQASKRGSIYLSVLIGILFLFSSYSVYAQAKDMDPTELEVLKEIITQDTIPTIYFKTGVTDLNQPLSRHLFYLNDFDLCSGIANLDSVKLKLEERNYLVERFANMESENINKLVREPKNYTLKKLEGSKWYVVSLPVVFRDGKYAIYYARGPFGGQFLLMENVEGIWMNVCSSTIWMQ